MRRALIVPSLLGGLVTIVWMFVVNGLFGFNAAVNMKQIADERRVYEVLKASITEPGRYVCNPEVAPGGFPGSEPVFSVLYSGVGHDAAGWMMLLKLPLFMISPMIAALLLWGASPKIRSSYPRKVLYVVAIGLLLGVSGRLGDFGIGGYPPGSALLLALHDVGLWAVVGLVLAWRIRAEPA